MLTIQQVRLPHTAAALAKRGKDYTSLLNNILEKDNERKKVVAALNILQEQAGSISQKIHASLAVFESNKAQDEITNQLKSDAINIKQQIEFKKTVTKEIENCITDLLSQIPNIPLEEVPEGLNSLNNVVMKEKNIAPPMDHIPMPHYLITEKYDLIDFETGAKLTGSGFPVYKGKCAALQRKLINFFLEKNIAAGYNEVAPPHLVNSATAFGTGQLPDKEGQMYVTIAEGFYLIPTAEVPVTNIYRDSIISESDLPLKLTAYSQCFRREAGSYGKEVRGLNRLHEFSKVEIVQFTSPEKSASTLEAMLAHVESLLIALKLPYRIVKLCGGDMGSASALTYDFEVYSTGQQRWLEVSSVSNFQTYQSNRMNTRYKRLSGKTDLVHTLNGSALALPRIMAALIEYQYNGQPNFLERIFALLK
jgi:seryl-tRNA synthetase